MERRGGSPGWLPGKGIECSPRDRMGGHCLSLPPSAPSFQPALALGFSKRPARLPSGKATCYRRRRQVEADRQVGRGGSCSCGMGVQTAPAIIPTCAWVSPHLLHLQAEPASSFPNLSVHTLGCWLLVTLDMDIKKTHS